MAIQGFSDTSIQAILSFRPRFELHTNFSNDLPTSQEVQKLIIDFIATLEQHGFLLKNFNWQEWITLQQVQLTETATLLTADIDTLQKLITAQIRTNRFIRGYLETLIAAGYFIAFLDRLEILNAGETQASV